MQGRFFLVGGGGEGFFCLLDIPMMSSEGDCTFLLLHTLLVLAHAVSRIFVICTVCVRVCVCVRGCQSKVSFSFGKGSSVIWNKSLYLCAAVSIYRLD